MKLSILEEYIETGNYQDLEILLIKNPALVNERTSHDISPLLLSCYYQKPQITNVLLKHIRTITIHEACAVGLKEQVQLMIAHKRAVLHELSKHGYTALGIATHFNKAEIVRILLQHQADPNVPSQNGHQVYPIHSATAVNNAYICKLLLDAGAEVNVQQYGGYTPLHFAASHGNIDLIIELLERGADLTIRSEQGESAADYALKKGFREIATILKTTS